MHRDWLGKVYAWAGSYRNVNMSKADFTFAAARVIPQLMDELEKTALHRHTPCIFESRGEVVAALAVVHTELVLIHPFREGNGRVARLLAILMGLQAGLPFLDFSGLEGPKREEYFAAVQVGMGRNYRPMEKLFEEIISRTLLHAAE